MGDCASGGLPSHHGLTDCTAGGRMYRNAGTAPGDHPHWRQPLQQPQVASDAIEDTLRRWANGQHCSGPAGHLGAPRILHDVKREAVVVGSLRQRPLRETHTCVKSGGVRWGDGVTSAAHTYYTSMCPSLLADCRHQCVSVARKSASELTVATAVHGGVGSPCMELLAHSQ
jgi:hypothetical protein